MVCFVLFTARPSFDALFRLIAPLLVMATALMPWADLWTIFLSSTFVAITDTTLTIAAVLFVITAAKRGTVNAAVGVGVTQGFLQLGVLAGNTVGSALSDVVTASPTGLFSVTLGILAFFSLAWFIYPANRTLLRPARPDGARPSGRAPGTVIYGITSLGATETPTSISGTRQSKIPRSPPSTKPAAPWPKPMACRLVRKKFSGTWPAAAVSPTFARNWCSPRTPWPPT